MRYDLDGTITKDGPEDGPFVHFPIWRDSYEVTKPTDKVDSYELGKLKAAMIIRVRIPPIFIIWYSKLRTKLT